MNSQNQKRHIRWFENLDSKDVSQVGGKNASLGEMIQALKHRGIQVPDGFATTAQAYREFLKANDLSDKIQALVGTGDASETLKADQDITLSCAEGDQGYVYDGILEFEETESSLNDIPDTRTRIMMNIASPAGAFRWWRLPAQGRASVWTAWNLSSTTSLEFTHRRW